MALIPTRLQPGDAMCFAGDRRKFPVAEVTQVIPEQWEHFMQQLPIPGQVGRQVYGITCAFDGETMEYMAGARVDSFDRLTDEHPQGRVKVPAANYAVFVHHGRNETIPATWAAIMEWVSGNGRYIDGETPPLEIYGEKYDPVSNASQFEIWFPVVALEIL